MTKIRISNDQNVFIPASYFSLGHLIFGFVSNFVFRNSYFHAPGTLMTKERLVQAKYMGHAKLLTSGMSFRFQSPEGAFGF
jgi:hypothetical protein